MTQTEALKLALDALENMANIRDCQREKSYPLSDADKRMQEAITAIKSALLSRSDGEAKGELVAWVYPEFWQHLENLNCGTAYRLSGIGRQPLYTTPPQRKPLTDEEILSISADCAATHQHTDIHFARAIESKLRSKNNG